MGSPVADLQQRAVEYARSGNFGPQALETNLELTRIAPANEGAWTRLARCYLEMGQLDEAAAALDAVLAVNAQNTIARNLQMEVTKRRVAVSAPPETPRARSASSKRRGPATVSGGRGFGRPEFAALGQLPPASAAETLGPRFEALLMALNERAFASKAVDTRNRAGRSGVRLFRRNSIYSGSAGHVYSFHHGGRWEPQLNIGLFAAEHWGRNCIRAGIGFNLTQDGADPDREAGQERVLRFFEHFQRLVAVEWRQLLTQWMTANGGFIQYGGHPPALDLLPAKAVDWIVSCANPVAVGWVFVGRWLFADKAADAETLGDGRRLVAWTDATFTDLLPLWATLYRLKQP